MSTDLHQQLAELKSRLSTTIFVEASCVYDHEFSITPKGGLDALCVIAEATRPSVVFYYLLPFTEESFKIRPLEPSDEDGLPILPEVDVSRTAQMKPYLTHVGETQSLTVYFLHEGHQITCTTPATWMEGFEAACEQAYAAAGQEQEAAKTRKQEKWQEERRVKREAYLKRLEETLPNDPEFCRLACEARPRVTDLNHRAKEVMGGTDIAESSVIYMNIRRIAAEIKTRAREAKKRK